MMMSQTTLLDRIAVGSASPSELSQADIEDLLATSVTHKVFTQAATQLLKLRPDLGDAHIAGCAARKLIQALDHNTRILKCNPQLRDRLEAATTPKDLLHGADQLRRTLRAAENQVLQALSRKPYAWAVIKGRSLGIEARDQGDLDLWFPIPDEATDFVAELGETFGVLLHDVALYRMQDGEACLKYHLFTLQGLLVEVHAGALQTYGPRSLSAPDAALNLNPGGTRQLPPELQLVSLLAHILRDGRVIARDILDFQAITHRADFAPEKASEAIRSAGLSIIATGVAARATAAGVPTPFAKPKLLVGLAGDLAIRHRGRSHESFQLGALAAQTECMLAGQSSLPREALTGWVRRIASGVERMLFPGQDGRVERVPSWRRRAHRLIFDRLGWDAFHPRYFHQADIDRTPGATALMTWGQLTVYQDPHRGVTLQGRGISAALLDYYKYPYGS